MINESLVPNVNTTEEEREQNNERGSACKTEASRGMDGNIPLARQIHPYCSTWPLHCYVKQHSHFCPTFVQACGGHGRHSA